MWRVFRAPGGCGGVGGVEGVVTECSLRENAQIYVSRWTTQTFLFTGLSGTVLSTPPTPSHPHPLLPSGALITGAHVISLNFTGKPHNPRKINKWLLSRLHRRSATFSAAARWWKTFILAVNLHFIRTLRDAFTQPPVSKKAEDKLNTCRLSVNLSESAWSIDGSSFCHSH